MQKKRHLKNYKVCKSIHKTNSPANKDAKKQEEVSLTTNTHKNKIHLH